MDSARSVAIDVNVTMFSSKNGSKVYATGASIYKMQNSYRNVLGEIETIITPDYDIRIDHEDQAVLILDKAKTDKLEKEFNFNVDLEKIKEYFDTVKRKDRSLTVELISNINNLKKYSVKGIDGFKSFEVELDMSNKSIRAVKFEYTNESYSGQYVVINYTKFEYNKDLAKYFKLSNYFTVQNNKYILNENFKGYQLYTEL